MMGKLYSKFLGLSFLLLSVNTLKAQFNYFAKDATKISGVYSDLGTAGTKITTNSEGTAMTFDDDYSSMQSIGFNFTFNGQIFSNFYLNSNGFIVLGNTLPASASNYVTNILAETDLLNAIAAYNYDLEGATSPEFRVSTAGFGGNGVCTIQFKGIRDLDASQFGGTFPQQYDSIEFQIKLYETTNRIEFVYGNFVTSANTSDIILASVGIKGNTADNSVNAAKASSTIWANASFIDGDYTGNQFDNRNSVLPVSGQIFRFDATILPNNDLSVGVIYGYGTVALFNSDTIKAIVTNAGALTQTNKIISLNITGAYPFSDSKTIASIGAGEKVIVTFLPYKPTAIGNNTATISSPTDDNNTNNTNFLDYRITTNYQSVYTAGAVTSIGFGVASDFVQRFSISNSATISNVTIGFGGGTSVTYRAAIFDASGADGSPGTNPIWESGILSTPAATSIITVPVNSIVTLPVGNFYVGVRQVTASSAGIIGEQETPVRVGEIFYRQGNNIWVDFSPINNFKLAFGVEFSVVLPVTIIQFKGSKKGKANQLSWITTSENNNKGFELEKSSNGINFSNMGFIATKSEGGFSNKNLSYAFNDEKPFKGTNYYRLKQLDKNGKATYSSIINIHNWNFTSLQLNAIYPNPVRSLLQLSIESPKSGLAQIIITNFDGKQVLAQNAFLNFGNNTMPVNVAGLMAGSYIVRIISSKELGESKATFIKQ